MEKPSKYILTEGRGRAHNGCEIGNFACKSKVRDRKNNVKRKKLA